MAPFQFALLLVLQLSAPTLCAHGPEKAEKWADYPAILYAEDINDEESLLGVWIARNWVLAPDSLMSSSFANIGLQSGDVVNAPLHHPIVREVEIEDDADEWVVFKTCVRSTSQVYQSLEPSAFADQSKNHTGLFLYAKYPSGELTSRAVNVLSYEAAKATFRSLTDFGTDHIDPYDICTEHDPSENSCSHVFDANGNWLVYPFLMVKGQVEGWMFHDHCDSTGKTEDGPTCFASTGFSSAAIKAGAGL